MPSLRSLLRRGAPFSLLIVLLAVAARLATPAGMMPAMTAHGPAFVLCSGKMAPAPVVPGQPAQDQGGNGDCPFAVAGLADAPWLPGAVIPAVPAPAYVMVAASRRDFDCPPGIDCKTTEATGPPQHG